MVDVDHFKQFNDTYGHDAGDVVLRSVARLLRRHGGGTAFRYGGEEFCLVYEGRRADGAPQHCEAARAKVQDTRIAVPPRAKTRRSADAPPSKKKLDQVSVTISVGCAKRGEGRRPAHEVLKQADQALYKAKQKGRNRVVEA